MITISTFKDQKVAVFGLGLSGISAAKALMAGGARVSAFDDSEQGRSAAVKNDIPVVDLAKADWSEFAALVLAPGVPLTHPKPHWTVELAKAKGVEIIGDTELFFRAHQDMASKAKIVAITGTNGKSTTSALLAHTLSHAGRKVELGGNIGRGVLDLEPFCDDRIYVIEFSSFQIDLTPSLKPAVAILLNITPDHLDRHGTLQNYANVKQRIFANLDADSLAVVGVDDEHCRNIASALQGDFSIQPISATGPLENGIGLNEGVLEVRNGQEIETGLSLDGMASLRGSHNGQNAAAAYATAKFLGLSDNEIEQGLRTFPGLPHRMELVGNHGPVLFINDSKATNADAAAKALASFKDIFWIAGGRQKDGGIEGLEKFYPNITKVYLIGECASEFAATLEGALPYEDYGTLDNAVAAAAKDAQSSSATEPLVLLSPAAASYDQFANFTIRGDTFRDTVSSLQGVTMRERKTS